VSVDGRVEEIIRELLGDDELEIHDSSSAHDFERWDSLMHVTIVYAIEDEFGIRFSEDEYAGFENVGELKELVVQKAGASA
jgi:acyl carrier protein